MTDSEEKLQELFLLFSKICEKNSEELASRNLINWLKQANLINASLTMSEADVMFYEIVKKSSNKLTLQGFTMLIGNIADKLNQDVEDVKQLLITAGPPVFQDRTDDLEEAATSTTEDKNPNFKRTDDLEEAATSTTEDKNPNFKRTDDLEEAATSTTEDKNPRFKDKSKTVKEKSKGCCKTS